MSIATDGLDAKEMDALCAQSARNNAREEITGILMTSGRRFLQALEGPRAVVEDAFLRIMLDPRHRDVILLSRRTTSRREFGDWAMAHLERGAECATFVERIEALSRNAPDCVRQTFSDWVDASD